MAFTVAVLLVLNIIVGAALYRRRVHKSQDPVQNAISAARSKTNQLNKVNLIAFLMTLTCFCEIIPILVILVLRSHNLLRRYDSQIFRNVTLSFTPLMLAFKPYILALVSPKIRKELWEALRCKAQDNRLRDLGVDIKSLRPTAKK